MRRVQDLKAISPLASRVRRSRSVHDVALQGIGSAIVRGEYPVGSLLPPKDVLMERLELSHTTLREALQTLAAKGMVAARAKVGTRVLEESHWSMFDAEILAWRLECGIPASFLAKLFEMRQSLESTAAALAAVRRTEEDVARLRHLAEALSVAAADRSAFVDADVAFHLCILDVAANPFMHSFGALIGTALSASFTLSAPTQDPSLTSLVRQQHQAIVDAIAARDAQGASDAMITVIRQGWINYAGLDVPEIARIGIAMFDHH